MEKKEVRKWQDEEALRRYRMIAPLLDTDMDEGKRQQLRGEAAEKNGVSKRTLYRYEKGYREKGFEGLRPASRTKKRQQRTGSAVKEGSAETERAPDHKGAGAGRMGAAGSAEAFHHAEASV